MHGITITIERFTDEWQPGWVECALVDVIGKRHPFEEKVPVVTTEDVDASSEYPRPGIIGCTIVRSRPLDGREVVIVDTSLPWRIESRSGRTQFEMFVEQRVEFPNEAR